jgi:hypothetical protein
LLLVLTTMAQGAERLHADVVGDTHDPSRNSRSSLEAPSTSPDDPQRVARDLLCQFGASGESSSKGFNASVITRMYLPERYLATGGNFGNQSAIADVTYVPARPSAGMPRHAMRPPHYG